jgi:two-component system sensor histidine kinase YesM
MIPIFTLQPIVENAIFHGIEAGSGKGTVSVSAKALDRNGIEITVQDDGVGMDAMAIQSILEDQLGNASGLFHKIGLYNVHMRIRYAYGQNYGLKIESELGKYTKVIIHIPYNADSSPPN